MKLYSFEKIKAAYIAANGQQTLDEIFATLYPELNYDTDITRADHIRFSKLITILNNA